MRFQMTAVYVAGHHAALARHRAELAAQAERTSCGHVTGTGAAAQRASPPRSRISTYGDDRRRPRQRTQGAAAMDDMLGAPRAPQRAVPAGLR